MTLKGLKFYLKNPRRIYAFFASRNLLNWMSDEAYLKLAFRMNMGKKLDLKKYLTSGICSYIISNARLWRENYAVRSF